MGTTFGKNVITFYPGVLEGSGLAYFQAMFTVSAVLEGSGRGFKASGFLRTGKCKLVFRFFGKMRLVQLWSHFSQIWGKISKIWC